MTIAVGLGILTLDVAFDQGVGDGIEGFVHAGRWTALPKLNLAHSSQ